MNQRERSTTTEPGRCGPPDGNGAAKKSKGLPDIIYYLNSGHLTRVVLNSCCVCVCVCVCVPGCSGRHVSRDPLRQLWIWVPIIQTHRWRPDWSIQRRIWLIRGRMYINFLREVWLVHVFNKVPIVELWSIESFAEDRWPLNGGGGGGGGGGDTRPNLNSTNWIDRRRNSINSIGRNVARILFNKVLIWHFWYIKLLFISLTNCSNKAAMRGGGPTRPDSIKADIIQINNVIESNRYPACSPRHFQQSSCFRFSISWFIRRWLDVSALHCQRGRRGLK